MLKYDGIRALHIGQLEYSLQCLEVANQMKSDAEVLLYLALAKQHQDDANPIELIALLTQAISLNDSLTSAYAVRAQILWAMGQDVEAEADMEVYLERVPDDLNMLLLKAKVQAKKGTTNEAITLCRELLEKDPYMEDAYMLLGGIYNSLGKKEEAITVYKAAKEMNPFLDETLSGEFSNQDGLSKKL
ncbi:MAG: tetratricopeptide repeat protein [Bacteroidales bacterium]|nr:tetratricopeptide repeat protein [Bacteroidales bacterium]